MIKSAASAASLDCVKCQADWIMAAQVAKKKLKFSDSAFSPIEVPSTRQTRSPTAVQRRDCTDALNSVQGQSAASIAGSEASSVRQRRTLPICLCIYLLFLNFSLCFLSVPKLAVPLLVHFRLDLVLRLYFFGSERGVVGCT